MIAAETRANMTGDGAGFLFASNVCEPSKQMIELSIKRYSGLGKDLDIAKVDKKIVLERIENRLVTKTIRQISTILSEK